MKLKRNSFAEGAILSYIAIVLTKVLGALYSIPFYSLIGEKGGFIYSCAYNIYAFFLDISTSGIPIALSILIGEYTALNKYRSRDKAYALSIRIVSFISIFAFLVMEFFAKDIAKFFISSMSYGATTHDIEVAIRIVALCILIVPFLAVERGYMQGNKFIATSSSSQVVEQLVRIFVVLAGAYITVMVMKLDVLVGVGTALTGAAVGGLAAFLYLLKKKKAGRALLEPATSEFEADNEIDSSSTIVRKLFKYSIVVITISVMNSIYNIVDIKLLIVGLLKIGYSDVDTQAISSIVSMWVPKIGNIIAALAIGMTSSIAPHIADDYTRGDLEAVKSKVNQAIEIILVIALPLAIGIAVFSDAVYAFFYGANPHGPYILIFSAFFNVIVSAATVFSMSLQSMSKGRIVCIAIVSGILMNMALDVPLILLLNSFGWHPYVGVTLSSILAQILTITLLAAYMSKACGISCSKGLGIFKKLALPLTALLLVCILMRIVWPPITERGLAEILQLAVYALLGMAVYFLLSEKTGVFERVFGKNLSELANRLLKR